MKYETEELLLIPELNFFVDFVQAHTNRFFFVLDTPMRLALVSYDLLRLNKETT